jgi:hypothetical protein
LWKFKWLNQREKSTKSAICEFSNFATADLAMEALVACGGAGGRKGGLAVKYAGKPYTRTWAASRQQQHQSQQAGGSSVTTRGKKGGRSRRRSLAAIASQPQL